MAGGKKKIAILGGGPAGIAAAFELTNDPELRSQFDITVHEAGWRLGGKCASGRNKDAGAGDRIEEHGLHVLGGCYDNTFWLLRQCYADWSPPQNSYKWTIGEAFKQHSFVTLCDGQFPVWPIKFRTNNETPGEERVTPGILSLIADLAKFLDRFHFQFFELSALDKDKRNLPARPRPQSRISNCVN